MLDFQNNKTFKLLIKLNEIFRYLLWGMLGFVLLLLFTTISGIYNSEFFLTSILQSDTAIQSFQSLDSGLKVKFIFLLGQDVVTLFLFTLIVSNFKKVFENIKKGEIFNHFNSKQFRKIAYITLTVTIVETSIKGVFLALILIVFAEIFKYGVELEEENRLTV